MVSALFAGLLTWAHLPASLLLGPMIGGVIVEFLGAGIRLPALPFMLAQGVIGTMVSNVLTANLLHTFSRQWPIFLATVLLIIGFNSALGWLISRLRILPGTTAIWGLLPGAASAMMVMAGAYGADTRLVAFMQYLRVGLVALFASTITKFWVHHTAAIAAPAMIWFPAIHLVPLLETLGLIIGGVGLGYLSKIPAGMLLIPFFVGAILRGCGWITVELPPVLLVVAYACVGWQVGLRFTREVLFHAFRTLPQILLSILTVILFSGVLAFGLVKLLAIDPLTAYLATSPGGADSVAVIAASTKVDVGFVMTLQISRFMLILLIGPMISKFVANRIAREDDAPTSH